jgi:hypothetical protein
MFSKTRAEHRNGKGGRLRISTSDSDNRTGVKKQRREWWRLNLVVLVHLTQTVYKDRCSVGSKFHKLLYDNYLKIIEEFVKASRESSPTALPSLSNE